MDKLFFDIESTGVNTSEDRIVQLSIIISDADGNITLQKQRLINPTIPIDPKATEIHGITDEDVKNEPTFKSIAKSLKTLFEGKVLVGYNILAFDVPLLMAEFDRAGVEVELSGKFIDVYKVESKLFPRDLSSIYEKYTEEKLEGAHDALKDVIATKVVMEHQVRNHDLSDDALMEMSENNSVDYYGKIGRNDDGDLIFLFGKHPGERLVDNVSYCNWILKSDFPTQVKNIVKDEIKRRVPAT